LALCWQPAATSAAVLNQQVPPDSTPAAHPVFASHSEQQSSFVAAGAESRLPCPRSQFGVNVQAWEVYATHRSSADFIFMEETAKATTNDQENRTSTPNKQKAMIRPVLLLLLHKLEDQEVTSLVVITRLSYSHHPVTQVL
jgi:hypothetical protein